MLNESWLSHYVEAMMFWPVAMVRKDGLIRPVCGAAEAEKLGRTVSPSTSPQFNLANKDHKNALRDIMIEI